MIRGSRVGFAIAAVTAGVLLLPRSGSAAAPPTVKGCQAALEKAIGKYESAVAKTIMACGDKVQGVLDDGDPVTNEEAQKCDDKFNKLINVTRVKARTKCLDSKCDIFTLSKLGHLVSGLNAPGSGALDWICTYIFE